MAGGVIQWGVGETLTHFKNRRHLSKSLSTSANNIRNIRNNSNLTYSDKMKLKKIEDFYIETASILNDVRNSDRQTRVLIRKLYDDFEYQTKIFQKQLEDIDGRLTSLEKDQNKQWRVLVNHEERIVTIEDELHLLKMDGWRVTPSYSIFRPKTEPYQSIIKNGQNTGGFNLGLEWQNTPFILESGYMMHFAENKDFGVKQLTVSSIYGVGSLTFPRSVKLSSVTPSVGLGYSYMKFTVEYDSDQDKRSADNSGMFWQAAFAVNPHKDFSFYGRYKQSLSGDQSDWNQVDLGFKANALVAGKAVGYTCLAVVLIVLAAASE